MQKVTLYAKCSFDMLLSMWGLYINYKYLPISLAIYKTYKVYVCNTCFICYFLCYVFLLTSTLSKRLLYDEVISLLCSALSMQCKNINTLAKHNPLHANTSKHTL